MLEKHCEYLVFPYYLINYLMLHIISSPNLC